MKKYTKPAMQVVELSVKESLSDIPFAFGRMATRSNLSANNYKLKNVTILTRTSTPSGANS